MKTTVDNSDSFTAEDIRKLRDDFSRRYTNDEGNIDWDSVWAKTEEGAATTRAEIARIRAGRGLSVK